MQYLLLAMLSSMVMYACPPVWADDHVKVLDDIIVTAPLHKQSSQTALPVSILSGEDLRLKAAGTLGETLSQELGITNASFGPGVGLPVIRGQSGPRVRILQDGTGSLDVSSLSPDHATSVEPILAERIEVLKGPATLLYGNGAIGGVVNVIDNRIPDMLPERTELVLEQRFKTVSDEIASVMKLEGAVGPIALHLDGFYRDHNDVDIDGFAINRETQSNDIRNSEGFIDNSNARAKSGTAGISLIGEQGFMGFATNHLENNYGIPPGADGDDEEAETVRVNLKQTRYDFKGEWLSPFWIWEEIRTRVTYNDYEHTELEDGEAGTKFENEAYEGRLELIHNPLHEINHGVIGLQLLAADFSAVGEEAFVPKTEKHSLGLFAVEDFHVGDWTFESGLRVESIRVNPDRVSDTHFTPVSASVSALWQIFETGKLSLSFSRSERAPEIEELFSDGVHLATQSFEQGDAGMGKETSHNVEFGLDAGLGWADVTFNLYYNWVDDYIILQNTGMVFNLDTENFESACFGDQCLPVRRYGQRDATFKGYEAKLKLPIGESVYGNLDLTLFSDYVRGKLDGAGDVPRLPPLRYGFQLDYGSTDWQTNVRVTRGEKQDHAGDNENETDSYLLLSAGFHYHLDFGEKRELLLFIKGNNLLDEEIRNATSLLRDFAPEPGRSVEFGIRMNL